MENLLNSPILVISIRSAIIIIITSVISKIVSKTLSKNKNDSMIHWKFMKNVVIAVIWIIGLTSVASQFSTFSKLANTILAGSGIIAAVIGLAAQESFANIFSGLFISLFKPFNIGDRISIIGDDTAGFVEDITLRHTVIRTYMNARVIIPNSIMSTSKIVNTTYSKGGSYKIEVTIAYENKEKRYLAQKILEEVVISHPLFYDKRTEEEKEAGIPPVRALCSAFESSGIKFTILMWTENIADNTTACSDCRMQILDRFEEAGIEIPYDKIHIVNCNK